MKKRTINNKIFLIEKNKEKKTIPIDLQGILQVLINLHYCSLVTASVAVIGSCVVLGTLLVLRELLYIGCETHQKRW